jgi:endonuclease III related protein
MARSLVASYPALVEALADRYGRPEPVAIGEGWFPAILAAFLGRSLGDAKVEATLAALREAGLIDAEALAEADPSEVAAALRPAGGALATRALRPLQRLARWAAGRDALDAVPTEALREDLLGLNGIGPASADAVLLHGLGRPVYPVDRSTYRILVRHGWLDPSAEYDEARSAVERTDPDDPAALARLAAWLERVGADYCRPSRPRCESCPLRPFLPDEGPIEPDS